MRGVQPIVIKTKCCSQRDNSSAWNIRSGLTTTFPKGFRYRMSEFGTQMSCFSTIFGNAHHYSVTQVAPSGGTIAYWSPVEEEEGKQTFLLDQKGHPKEHRVWSMQPRTWANLSLRGNQKLPLLCNSQWEPPDEVLTIQYSHGSGYRIEVLWWRTKQVSPTRIGNQAVGTYTQGHRQVLTRQPDPAGV